MELNIYQMPRKILRKCSKTDEIWVYNIKRWKHKSIIFPTDKNKEMKIKWLILLLHPTPEVVISHRNIANTLHHFSV